MERPGTIPTLLPEGFRHEATGGTDNADTLVFWACPLCGACVVEHGHKDHNRRIHLKWHKENQK